MSALAMLLPSTIVDHTTKLSVGMLLRTAVMSSTTFIKIEGDYLTGEEISYGLFDASGYRHVADTCSFGSGRQNSDVLRHHSSSSLETL
jgi:hypothetical protein